MPDRRDEQAQLRIPPSEPEVGTLFTAWRAELATCRKSAPTIRNHAASKPLSQVGLRVSEACGLDLDDIKWDLGRFGKLHVRHGRRASLVVSGTFPPAPGNASRSEDRSPAWKPHSISARIAMARSPATPPSPTSGPQAGSGASPG
ncbi:hypothetical protein ACFYM2_09830 [Streptomyces sp. NPDC006711]|uniref:hypothetical protein n=1 Tax=Streptomyces sp. NPDC006711 TaxID=3364762 RepID=UPI00369FCDBC